MSSPDRSTDPRALLDRLTAAPGRAERLTHLEVLPPRSPTYGGWPAWVDPMVLADRFGVDSDGRIKKR